ncbi:MAG: exonuclease domain-containing protein [Saprospiraceae bacterium]
MKKKIYAIIDIETTGGKASRDKITEIAVVLHDGEQIIDRFESLVNPERSIPYNITQITGITQEMVEHAPKFYELAKKIVELTEGTIFVAHNVRFDYGFIVEEFRRLGFSYVRKQLCTVRLSRKAFPGLRSYALGNLIKHFGISVNDRHRAMADVLATVEVFEKILAQESGEEQALDLINLGIKEAKLPANIKLEQLHALPEQCGIYYFYDKNGKVVYVGKSINIKKRMMEHFADKTDKGAKLQKSVHEITFELTGSELVALLLEDSEIKNLKPTINRAQRRSSFPYVIFHYLNEDGYICFGSCKATAKMRKTLNVISEYPKAPSAKSALKYILNQFELCNKLCQIEAGEGACFYYHIKKCHGACITQEAPETYNERATLALEALTSYFQDDFVIIDEGRTAGEKAVILIEDGAYRGFGYLDMEENNGSIEDIKECIVSYKNNPDTIRIIRRFLNGKHHAKVVPF